MSLKTFIKIRRERLLLWLTFWLTIALFPIHRAGAQFGIEILTAPLVFLAKLATMFVILVPLSWGFLKIAELFLTWTTNPVFIGGVINNAFVQDGWRVVRDFSNMFFILIIVAIGIATALRIKQYEVRKTLPRLIVVALLINFSPVICGVVIDAANIFTNFFLTAGSAGFEKALTLSGASGNYMTGAVRNALGNWAEVWKGILFFKLLIIAIFNFFGAFVLFLLGMLFMMRHLVLWVLVILSPLAFLSAVLPPGKSIPGTKKKSLFGTWRKEFLNWCFIGVTASFFIYLSQLMLHIGMENLITQKPTTGVTVFGGKIVTNIMVMSIPFVFLFIGYFISIKTSAMGASFVTGAAKKFIGRVNPATKEGRQTLNRLRKQAGLAGAAVASKIPGVEKAANRVLERKPEEWKNTSGIKKVGKVIARGVLPYWARERMAAPIATRGEGAMQAINKQKEEADKLQSPEARRAAWKKAKRENNVNRQLGILQSAIDKKEMDNYSKDEIKNAIERAGKINKKLAEKIMQAAPDVAQEMYEKGQEELKNINNQITNAQATGERGKAKKLQTKLQQKEDELKKSGLWLEQEDRDRYGSLEEKIMLTMKSKDIGKIRKDYITSNQAQQIIQDIKHKGQSAWTGSKLAKMAEEFEAPAVEAYNKTTDDLGKDWFQYNNPARKWIESSPGAYAAGYRSPRTLK